MRNKLILLLVSAGLALLSTGCAMLDPLAYKDGRMAFKIKVDGPRFEAAAKPNKICLINQSIAVFPFVDSRKISDITYGTSVPISLLAAGTLAANSSKYGIFRQIALAPEESYRDQKLTFDAQNFGVLKDLSRSTGVLWGNIYRFEITIKPSAVFQNYDMTVFIYGSIKMMLGKGNIYYNHEFSKKRTYTFKSNGWITYNFNDIYALGPYINDFIDWAMKGELDNIAVNSKQINSGAMIANDVIPDTLAYPPENTKLYSFSDINTARMVSSLTVSGCGLLGGIAGIYVTKEINKNSESSGWYAVFLGLPAGELAGTLIGYLLTAGNTEKMEKEALFYATAPVLSPDVVLSMNLVRKQF